MALAPPRPPRLIGRSRELAELLAELARASLGEPRCVLLTGDAGVGKSRLARELVARNHRTAIGLFARAHPLSATDPYSLWVEALERYLQDLPPEARATLCRGVEAELSGLLHGLGPRPPPRPVPRVRLLAAFAALIGAITTRAPLIVVLDDVHLADASSVDLLGHLLAGPGSRRLLVLLTARLDQAAAEPVQEILLGLEEDLLLRRLAMEPLDRPLTGELARAALGRDRVPEALLSWLWDRSRGNPLFALGLLRALQDVGGDLERPQLSQVPEGLRERVKLRLGRLSGPAMTVLELLAVFGQPAHLEQLASVSGRQAQRLGPILEELVARRLVVEVDHGAQLAYEIQHPLILEAIYEGIGAVRQRAIHGQLARSLLASGRLVGAAGHFMRAAGPGDQEAIAAILDAFRRARQRESGAVAMALLEALLALIPPGDPRWLEVLDQMAEDEEWVLDHQADLRPEAAVQALRRIQGCLPARDPRRGLVELRLATFLAFGVGDLEAAERCARAAVELSRRDGQPARARLAANERGWVLGLRGDLAAQELAARRALKASRASPDAVSREQALSSLAWVSVQRGQFAAAGAALRRCAALAGSAGHVYRLTWCLSLLAFSCALEGRLAEAHDLVEEALTGDPAHTDTLLLELRAWVSWIGGDHGSAVQQWSESTARRWGAPARRAWCAPVALVAMAELGRVPEARRRLDELEARPRWACAELLGAWADGTLLEREGDREAAMRRLEQAADGLRDRLHLPLAAFVLADLAECAFRARHAEAAAAAAGRLDVIASQLDCDLPRALADLAASWASLAAGDRPAAAERAAAAASRHARMGCAGFRARSLESLGRALAPRDRQAAARALADSARLADALGASWRGERTREALAGLGGVGRRLSGRPGVQLTSREQDVAALAARGLTAAEIARRLQIGIRTVETHIAHVYVKLGIESRRDLVYRAAELGLAAP